MAFYRDAGPTKHSTDGLTELAKSANRLATAAVDAGQSYQNVKDWIEGVWNHPAGRKLKEATKGQRMPLYFLLSAGFGANIYWEWVISSPIYEVLFPGSATWVPVLVCTTIAFWSSACFAENSSHFSLLRLRDEAGIQDEQINGLFDWLYGRGKRGPNQTVWLFHPILGILLAIFVVGGVFVASWYRVELMKTISGSEVTPLHLYLPPALYAVEILFGIPAYFTLAWGVFHSRVWLANRKLGHAKRATDLLRRTALEQYTQYLERYAAYSEKVQREGWRVVSPQIPPHSTLRQIAKEELGYDPWDDHQRGANGQANEEGPFNKDSWDEKIDGFNRGL